MKPIADSMISRLIHLRYAGASYKEIAKKLDIGVGTAHKYARNVRVSPSGVLRLKRKLTKKQNLFKRCYATPKEIPIIRKLTLSKVRIIAHCLFDGSAVASGGDYIVKYTNASWELIKQFMIDMHDIYGLNPFYIGLNDGKNYPWWEVLYCSKKMVQDLFRYSRSYSTSRNIGLPKGIERQREFIRAFLRAFWEDEGCITHEGQLIGTLKNKRLIKEIERLHKRLNIDCVSRPKGSCYIIRIKRNLANLRRFQKEIGFGESIITRGKFVGIKRKVVLSRFLDKLA